MFNPFFEHHCKENQFMVQEEIDRLNQKPWRVGYKLVQVDHEHRRWSAVGFHLGSKPKVRYFLGRLILAPRPHGGLGVFQELEDAIRFCWSYTDTRWGRILSKHLKDFEIFEVQWQLSDRCFFWYHTEKNIRIDCDMYDVPSGTMVADFVRMGHKPVWSYRKSLASEAFDGNILP